MKANPYVRITAYFLIETLKSRSAWDDIFQALENNLDYCVRQSYPS
jgi:hypothetical protein